MAESEPTIDKQNHCTILLVSGDLDKALVAFEIALGLAAMGKQVDMWFALYGVNCLKKPRSLFSFRKWFPKKATSEIGRKTDSDIFWQKILGVVNYDGAKHIPLSQLNLFGMGPMVLNRIMNRKGMASLEEMINYAKELNVNFKICQVCVDVMALDVSQDIVVDAEVFGVSRYILDSQNAYYNTVI